MERLEEALVLQQLRRHRLRYTLPQGALSRGTQHVRARSGLGADRGESNSARLRWGGSAALWWTDECFSLAGNGGKFSLPFPQPADFYAPRAREFRQAFLHVHPVHRGPRAREESCRTAASQKAFHSSLGTMRLRNSARARRAHRPPKGAGAQLQGRRASPLLACFLTTQAAPWCSWLQL